MTISEKTAVATAMARSNSPAPGAKRNHADLNSLDKLGFITSKSLYQVKGCTDEQDAVSMLNNICQEEF